MAALRKTNQSDPRRKERALRLFLLQTRGLETWSDGNRLVEAEELYALRAGILNRLVSLRGGAPDRREAENGRVWRNYQSLCRMRERTDKEPLSLIDRMIDDLKISAAGQDPGSGDRKRFLRRALRRLRPDALEALPLNVRCGGLEADQVLAALQRRVIRTRHDLSVNGFLVPAGYPVSIGRDGRARLAVFEGEPFPAEGLHTRDLKRKRPRKPEAPGPSPGL